MEKFKFDIKKEVKKEALSEYGIKSVIIRESNEGIITSDFIPIGKFWLILDQISRYRGLLILEKTDNWEDQDVGVK